MHYHQICFDGMKIVNSWVRYPLQFSTLAFSLSHFKTSRVAVHRSLFVCFVIRFLCNFLTGSEHLFGRPSLQYPSQIVRYLSIPQGRTMAEESGLRL